jgi:hypothetical protein
MHRGALSIVDVHVWNANPVECAQLLRRRGRRRGVSVISETTNYWIALPAALST